MRIRMLHGRRLVHLILVDGEDAVLACDAKYDIFGYRPFQDAAESVSDDELITCKKCLKIGKSKQ